MNPTSTRRTLLKGAAWSAPVVLASSAAPALAASADPCQPQPVTVDWESANYTRLSDTRGQYRIPLSDGSSITLDVRSEFVNMDPGTSDGTAPPNATANDNLRLSQFYIGGTGQRGLVLHQNEYNYYATPNYQRVTFTFSRPINTLDFQVTDIDAAPGDFVDEVAVSSNLTAVGSSALERTTWQGLPSWSKRTYDDTENASGLANLRVTGHEVSEFTLTYANSDRLYETYPDLDRDQRVFLTDFHLTVPPIGCP